MQLYALASMTSWVYSILQTPQAADRQPGARYFKVKSHQPPKKRISNYHIGNIKGLKTYFDIGQIKIYWGDKKQDFKLEQLVFCNLILIHFNPMTHTQMQKYWICFV